MKKKIIGVFKTHFDYGYTDLAEVVLDGYCNKMLDDAICVCKQTQSLDSSLQYKWTLPSFLLVKMAERCMGERKKDIYDLVERGQIVSHALPFTMHTELLDCKMLDHLFIFTDEYVKTFHKPFPISAKMTDVPGHTSALIKPLLERGVKFLHLGKNGASLAPDVPLLFWWEDLEGNRILTMYNQNYGSDLLPPKGWKYPVWLALCHTYDNKGVHGAGFIEEIRNSVGNDYDFSTGTLDDFANELLKCDLGDIPVVRGELGDTWIHGVASLPKAVSVFRRSRKEFYRLEEFAQENKIDIDDLQEEFYKTALVYSEHTFGANILKFLGQSRAFDKDGFVEERKTREAYKILERSWEEQLETANALVSIVEKTKQRLGCGAVAPQNNESPIEVNLKEDSVEWTWKEKKYSVRYEYRLFGAQDLFDFMHGYLQRYYDWSISDFGRNYYPEIEGQVFYAKPLEAKTIDGYTEIELLIPTESYNVFGNFTTAKLRISVMGEKLHIILDGKQKVATPLVEAGNLLVYMDGEEERYYVDRCGKEVNVDEDIVKDANQILWSVDHYARIGNRKLYSIDAPLISFGENAVCRFNGGTPRKKSPVFVVNLFNNHWGTNFPQWIEGDLSYEFFIE